MTFEEWFNGSVPRHRRDVIEKNDWVKVWMREAFEAGRLDGAFAEEIAEAEPVCEKPKARMRADVLRERRENEGGAGCCDRYANMQACDCLKSAAMCPECQNTGYTLGGPMNGRNRKPYTRCPNGCPVQCSVCGNPNCDNPNGQH